MACLRFMLWRGTSADASPAAAAAAAGARGRGRGCAGAHVVELPKDLLSQFEVNESAGQMLGQSLPTLLQCIVELWKFFAYLPSRIVVAYSGHTSVIVTVHRREELAVYPTHLCEAEAERAQPHAHLLDRGRGNLRVDFKECCLGDGVPARIVLASLVPTPAEEAAKPLAARSLGGGALTARNDAFVIRLHVVLAVGEPRRDLRSSWSNPESIPPIKRAADQPSTCADEHPLQEADEWLHHYVHGHSKAQRCIQGIMDEAPKRHDSLAMK
mmetsp:Transcript_65239/g.190894  ORF Transcript_65239/g.190894 Transcript_65239/m.190894 type:complete len:270 (+) Transcript_65239:2067-2876(+)